MNRYLLTAIFCIIFFSFPAFPQQQEEPDVSELSTKERIFLGGSIGLQFGTVTSIQISPIAGYRITNRLSAGIGGTYQYNNDRTFSESFSSHLYGGRLFARFLVIRQVFIHAEYERISFESYRFGQVDDRIRTWEDNYFLGAGYRIQMGEKSWFNIMVLFNLNPDSEVYYQNPQFRFGLEFGL